MKDGIVQQVDTPQNLYNAPKNLFVAGFIGSPQMNVMDAVCHVKDNEVELEIGGTTIALPASKRKPLIDGGYDGKTVVMGIRPEHVYDDEARIQAFPGSVIQGKITVYELLGAEVYLYFDTEGFPMTARVNPRTTARTGDVVKFSLDLEKDPRIRQRNRTGYYKPIVMKRYRLPRISAAVFISQKLPVFV